MFFLLRPYKEVTVKISHLGLRDPSGSMKDLTQQREFGNNGTKEMDTEESNEEIFHFIKSIDNLIFVVLTKLDS